MIELKEEESKSVAGGGACNGGYLDTEIITDFCWDAEVKNWNAKCYVYYKTDYMRNYVESLFSFNNHDYRYFRLTSTRDWTASLKRDDMGFKLQELVDGGGWRPNIFIKIVWYSKNGKRKSKTYSFRRGTKAIGEWSTSWKCNCSGLGRSTRLVVWV